MTIENMDDAYGFVVNCDFCPDYFEYESEDFLEVVEEVKSRGWKFSKNEKGEWTHKCVACQEGK